MFRYWEDFSFAPSATLPNPGIWQGIDVLRVKYPFLPSHPQYELARRQMRMGGGMVTFELEGGVERGRTFLNSLQMLSHTANLGDTRSIATHPASTTHSKLSDAERAAVGIYPGLIRISVGLESYDDILRDIQQAIEKSKLVYR